MGGGTVSLCRLFIASAEVLTVSVAAVCRAPILQLWSACLSCVSGLRCARAVCRAPILQALVGVFELPEAEDGPEDAHFVDVDESQGYQAAFSQLLFAPPPTHDPLKGTDYPRRAKKNPNV